MFINFPQVKKKTCAKLLQCTLIDYWNPFYQFVFFSSNIPKYKQEIELFKKQKKKILSKYLLNL